MKAVAEPMAESYENTWHMIVERAGHSRTSMKGWSEMRRANVRATCTLSNQDGVVIGDAENGTRREEHWQLRLPEEGACACMPYEEIAVSCRYPYVFVCLHPH